MLPWISSLLLAKKAVSAFYVDFDGSTEYLSSANVTHGIADAWTYMFHVRPATPLEAAGAWMMMGSGANNNNKMYFTSATPATSFRIQMYGTGGGEYKDLTHPSVFAADVGVHLVITYDGAAVGDPVIVYKNGTALATGTGTNSTGTRADSSMPCYFISHYSGSARAPVHMESIAVWSSVLSAAEASALYSGRKTLDLTANSGSYVSSAALKHWYRPWKNSASMGFDYATGAGTRVNFTANALTAADIFPGDITP